MQTSADIACSLIGMVIQISVTLQFAQTERWDSWRKESLNLQFGDFIIWRDEAVELEGQSAVVTQA